MVFDLHGKVLLGCFLFFPLIPHSAYNVIRLRIGDLLFFERSSTTILKVFKAVIEKPYWKHLENTVHNFLKCYWWFRNPAPVEVNLIILSHLGPIGVLALYPSTKHQINRTSTRTPRVDLVACFPTSTYSSKKPISFRRDGFRPAFARPQWLCISWRLNKKKEEQGTWSTWEISSNWIKLIIEFGKSDLHLWHDFFALFFLNISNM